jgi:CRISPR-associated protein Cst1
MLKYTGHPLVDVGAATIMAYCKKKDLSNLNESDLSKMADYISKEYIVNPLKSFLTVAFPNSGFTQPAFDKTPEKRGEYAERVTRCFSADKPVLDERCVFTGDPATSVAFGDKDDYPPGRAFRQHIPLLLGENKINFFAKGDSGLPISGKAMLCIQAMPLGCAKCGGKLLAVHSDNPDIIELFAGQFLKNNERAISAAHIANGTKLPEAGPAKTLLIETLLKAEEERRLIQEERPSSITAYHFSNSGQSNALDARNPPLEIYQLPMDIISFLGAIKSAEYNTEWNAIANRAWQLTTPKKGKKGEKETETSEQNEPRRRNYLYEDLFSLPQNAPKFIRHYFLRIPVRKTFNEDPRRSYSLQSDAGLVSWKLTSLFLERVMHIKDSRINRIREIGDQLAEYVNEENDKKFFSAFYSEYRYDNIRNALIRVNHSRLKQGKPPIIKFEPFIEVFEEVDDKGRSDWRLARDLVLIRMIERLYDLRWIEKHVEEISEMDKPSEGDSENKQ